jgi:hypothetical protein
MGDEFRKEPRNPPHPAQLVICLTLAGIILAGTACGGGSSQGLIPSSSVSSVSPQCMPSSIAVNATSQCNAEVQGMGAFSSSVTWLASAGTINPSGLLTAPSSSGIVTVTATSTRNLNKSGSASVAVLPSPQITSVAVICAPATIGFDATSQCRATVQGTGDFSSAVAWSTSAGAINASGLLTAPGSPATVTVTATSTQDPTKSGMAIVAVQLETPPSKHVVIVMEENQSYSTVVGNTTDWPNLNNLISHGALPTNF